MQLKSCCADVWCLAAAGRPCSGGCAGLPALQGRGGPSWLAVQHEHGDLLLLLTALILGSGSFHTNFDQQLRCVQTMVEDRESGYLLSAVNCYFMCQVCLSSSTSWCKFAQLINMRCSLTA